MAILMSGLFAYGCAAGTISQGDAPPSEETVQGPPPPEQQTNLGPQAASKMGQPQPLQVGEEKPPETENT